MKRRDFIAGMGMASTALFHRHALSQDDAYGPHVFPEEQSERREYDRTAPGVVAWHTAPTEVTYPKKTVMRTVGFVEAASDEHKLLYIPGFLVRQEPPMGMKPGFYLYFKTDYCYLALPRRLEINGKSEIQERYAFDEQFSVNSVEGIKSHLFTVDFRDTKLTEKGKVYSPNQLVFSPLNENGSLSDKSFLKNIERDVHPEKDLKRSYSGVIETLYFEMDHTPLSFKLELPPLVFDGFTVPLPVCYFEPYDILRKKWV